MKKSIKNKILIPLVVLFTLSIALFGLFNLAPKASVDATFAGYFTEARVGETENDAGKRGMRFTSYLPRDNADLTKAIEDGYQITAYGTFIMPAYYADADHKGVGITEESLFGANPSYIFDQKEDTSLDLSVRPWKIINAVCVPDTVNIDGTDCYAIKASVDMSKESSIENLNTKYTARAYFKAENGEGDVKYVLAETPAEDKSLLDVVVNAYDAWLGDQTKINAFDKFINDYTDAYPDKAIVPYTIVHKYNGSEEVKATSGTAKIGSSLEEIVAQYSKPTDATAAGLQKDYNYYYFDETKDLGLLRAKPDGTTKIVIDFNAKKVYANADYEMLPLNKYTAGYTGNEPYADSYAVDVKNGENVKTATVTRKDVLKLIDDTTTSGVRGVKGVIKIFSATEVYEIKAQPITGFITNATEMTNIINLGTKATVTSGNYKYGDLDYFVIKNDIDMTGYVKGHTTGTSYHCDGYGGYGLQGTLDGNGKVLYNLSTTLIDIMGVNSTMKNLTVIGTGMSAPVNQSVGLITRANYGKIYDCKFDITAPDKVTSWTSTAGYTWTGVVFDAMTGGSMEDCVVRVHCQNSIGSTIFGNCASGSFVNTYVYTDSDNVCYSTDGKNEPIVDTIDATFNGDTESFSGIWSFDTGAQLPTLYGRTINHKNAGNYAGYVLNGNARMVNPNTVTVEVDDVDYVVSHTSLANQAIGNSIHVCVSGNDSDDTSDDSFVVVTVNKVTAIISTPEQFAGMLYLAGGTTANNNGYGKDEILVLADNIDMTNKFMVLGAEVTGTYGDTNGPKGFQGTLDGCGYAITNLTSSMFNTFGNNAVLKNIAIVSGVIENNGKFLGQQINGKLENVYIDIYSNASNNTNVLTNYGYSGDFINCIVKVNCDNNNAYVVSNSVASSNYTNTYIVTNSAKYFSGNDSYKPSVAPTVVGLDGLSTSQLNAFIDGGADTSIWDITANGFGFKSLSVVEKRENVWGKYVYTDANCTATTANTVGFTLNDVVIPVSDLSAIQEGKYYLSTTLSGTTYTRDLVQVVTSVLSTAKEFASLVKFTADLGSDTNPKPYGGYFVLTNDIDMAGISMSKGQNPSSGSHYNNAAFDGTIDGMGNTIYNYGSGLADANTQMFYSLGGANGAVIKNLNLVDCAKSLAATMGKVTIENCDLHFNIHTNSNVNNYHYYTAALASSSNGVVTLKDTNVKIQNVTGSSLYFIQTINSGSVLFDNSKLYAQEKWVPSFDASASISVDISPDISINYYDEAETFYYGRFAFDPATKDIDIFATEIANYNKWDLTGTFNVDGTTFTLPNTRSVLNLTSDDVNANVGIDFGLKKAGILVRGDSGSYYTIDVYGCWFAVSDKYDLVNLIMGMRATSWQQPAIKVAFNADIDMSGITSINKQTITFDGTHGYRGIIEGNGKTIKNLATPIFGHTNTLGTIRNLTFDNLKSCINERSSGGTFQNITFNVDATGMSSICLINKSNNSRNELNLTDCKINVTNAGAGFICYVDYDLEPTYTPGTINVNNLALNINAGTFKLCKSSLPENDIVGPYNSTIASMTVTKVK